MSKKPIDRGHIGENLKRARESLGLTGDELAEKAGVGIATVRGLEAGGRINPKTDTLKKLADALGITVAELQRQPATTPIAPLIPLLLKEYSDVLKPLGITDETHPAIQWLLGLDPSVWRGITPTVDTLFNFVRGFLASTR